MLLIYRYFINLLFPFIIILIYFRKFFNKEHKTRYKEKLFISSFNVKKNKRKKLIWFHAASIGELKSIIPLIKEIDKKKKFNFLITTVTVSSSYLVKKELKNKNVIHRFFPIDKQSVVNKFLDQWSPNIILFVDSEIWPNFLLTIKKRNIPLILLNGRITQKTFSRWNKIPITAKKVFQSFNLCLPSSKTSKKYLKKLKAKNIKYYGNLKLTSEKTSTDLNLKNKSILKNKKFWCAASTHKGEDIFCLNVHLKIKKKYNDIITIIIPRHVERASNIDSYCKKIGLKSQILSEDSTILKNSEILIVNTYGVLINYLQFSRSVFIGKSMIKRLEKVGGQNPIEAAKLGCKIYHGPYVYNFRDIYELLNKHKISEQVKNEIELANKIKSDLNKKKIINNNKIVIINKLGKEILNQTLKELKKTSLL